VEHTNNAKGRNYLRPFLCMRIVALPTDSPLQKVCFGGESFRKEAFLRLPELGKQQ
jgi:hypothetical protein